MGSSSRARHRIAFLLLLSIHPGPAVGFHTSGREPFCNPGAGQNKTQKRTRLSGQSFRWWHDDASQSLRKRSGKSSPNIQDRLWKCLQIDTLVLCKASCVKWRLSSSTYFSGWKSVCDSTSPGPATDRAVLATITENDGKYRRSYRLKRFLMQLLLHWCSTSSCTCRNTDVTWLTVAD